MVSRNIEIQIRTMFVVDGHIYFVWVFFDGETQSTRCYGIRGNYIDAIRKDEET